MDYPGDARDEWEVSGRAWRFANFDFDESSRELRADGEALELESKPLEVLYQLLLHAGEVVTKEELLESVWPGVTVVEGSLATAVSKLRKAFGEDSPVVVTVPRIGYRLGVPVQCRSVAAPPVRDLGFQPGQFAPGRDQWKLVRRLDASLSSEVWLAEHFKTREPRVFKYAADGIRLKALKREVTLARLLRDSLGDRPDFVRVLEWNFDSRPYYVESEFCGPNLAEWADSHGGLAAIPLPVRLRVMVDLTSGVAAAHAAGVLHKDLKPANILVAPRSGDDIQVKVADFGSGALTDPARLHALGITNLGFTKTISPETDALTGTLMYLPPEVLAGQSPTASADVYALGVILYQLLAGDFRKPLSPGWEANIDDPLLREDIADAACGDPARRLATAALLLERLQSLDRRRAERRELDLARERAQVAERRLDQARARRPWIAAAILALAAGLAVSIVLYRRADRETAIASRINHFLSDDLLARTDPFQSGASQEPLSTAVKDAAANIDRQFSNAPGVAARLHFTIAKALDNRSDYQGARPEYERAAALFIASQGALSEDAIEARLQQAVMEARSYVKDSLPLARSIVSQQETLLSKISRPRPDLPVWLASARGMIALIDNHAKDAASQFQIAYDAARKLSSFDETARLQLQRNLAFAYIRSGDGATAERLFRDLIAAFTRTSGADSPSVLRVRLNLAQAFMIEGKNREAVEEANRIYPQYVTRLGENHELTMQLLTTRAQCEGTLGLFDDSIRDDLAIYNLAIQKQGAASFFAIATLSDAALAQCRAGHVADGEANARKAYDTSAKTFGPRAGLTGGAAYTLATCQIGRGQLAEATTLLRGIDNDAVAQLAGFPGWHANVDLALAEIAYRQADLAGARKYLNSAAPVFSQPDAEPYQKRALETLRAALTAK